MKWKPEKRPINIGFVPLTDSAPLIVASELGFFKQHGLNVTLEMQHSWATLRDKLHAGILDAAQMLAPMPFASTLGLGCQPTPVISPMVVSLNGNAITLSQALYQELLAANKLSNLTLPMAAYLLQQVIAERAAAGKAKLRFAHVFPYSCHHYQLRDWLSGGGVSADQVDIIVVPPVNMVDALKCGDIDGYCVGGPWNAKAVRAGIGVTCLTSYDIWQDSPEKVLGFTEQFYRQHPNTVLGLCAALKQACNWLNSVPNRFEAARLLCEPQYLGAELDVIAPSLLGSCLTSISQAPRQVPGYNQFSCGEGTDVNRPNKSSGEWLIKQMLASGQIAEQALPQDIVAQVFRRDIYDDAQGLLKEPAPR